MKVLQWITRGLWAVFLCLMITMLSYWGISILKCEYLTQKYAQEYLDIVLEDMEIERLHTIKVLDHNDTNVRVYYVLNHYETKKPAYGFVAELSGGKRIHPEFSDTCVWSKYGSASEVIWPYWWHFIYGGL